MPSSDWKDFAAVVGTAVGVPGLLAAAFKGWREWRRSNEQREEELKRESRIEQLRRAEFTLAQLRRLFEDQDLLDMLPLLDTDDVSLAGFDKLNSKRKFMSFCEEIALLVNSGLLAAETAYYMFGYYAVRAHAGNNFRAGHAYTPEHWALFMKFAADSEAYIRSNGGAPATQLRL